MNLKRNLHRLLADNNISAAKLSRLAGVRQNSDFGSYFKARTTLMRSSPKELALNGLKNTGLDICSQLATMRCD